MLEIASFFAGWMQTILVIFCYICAFWLVEAWRPAERTQPILLRLSNLHYVAWGQGINLALTPWIAAALVGLLREQWPGLVYVNTESSWQVFVLAAVGYFAAVDVFYYWLHRLQHRIPLLWRTHRLHHSDLAMNASSALRTHWLEEPFKILALILPLHFIFEIPPQMTGLTGVLVGGWLFFVHANIRLGFGQIGHLLLVSPQVHRIHHSRLTQHRDRNFALFFPVLDRLFGTWSEPGAGEYPATGLSNGGRYDGVIAGLLSPFQEPTLESNNERHTCVTGGHSLEAINSSGEQGLSCQQQPVKV